MDKYVMDPDGTTRAVSYAAWVQGVIRGDAETVRRIGRDQVGAYEVSTVFLGIDHRYGDGPPLLFETMVFDTSAKEDRHSDLFCDRYSTRDEAAAGHARVVAALQSGTPVGDLA